MIIICKEKWLIILTDGSHTEKNSADPVPIARAMRDNGINIIAIAIGAHINLNRLAQLTGKTFKYLYLR